MYKRQNLVDVALSSGGDMKAFWKIFDERLDLCYRALMCRHNRLRGTLSDAAPILWQNGALARLKKGETIDRLLYGGYSTISLGYAGLYELSLIHISGQPQRILTKNLGTCVDAREDGVRASEGGVIHGYGQHMVQADVYKRQLCKQGRGRDSL